jgi:hypothetical protein
MAKGFDIEKIEVKDSDKNIEKLLTGNVETGLQKDDPRKPNAEIEGDEFLKYPDGNVKKAEGPRHESGGIKVDLPKDTEVVSNSIYLTKSEVKKLGEEFDITLSTKDTYASALDKYSKKIGLTKLNDEQEDVFAILKKEIEKKAVDKGTSQINNEYLSKKIYDIESKKKPLEDKRKSFFDTVFNIQESKKKENKEGEFKYGGTQEEAFNNLLKKYNLSEEEGRRAMDNLPIFDKGGEFIKRIEAGEDANAIYTDLRKASIDGTLSETEYNDVLKRYYDKYPSTSTETSASNLSDEEKTIVEKKWNGNEKAYLDFKTISEKTKDPKFSSALYEQYKQDIENDKNYTKGKKGSWYDALKDRSESEVVEQLLAQEERNARLEAYGLDPLKTDQNTTKGARTNKQTIDFINQHKEELGDILPGFEKGYIGQAAYISYNNLLSSDKSGYKGYKKNQTGVNDEALGKISSIDNDNTNTTLGHRMSGFDPIVADEEKKAPTGPAEKGPITDKVDLSVRQQRARAFYTPDQSVLPPSGQQPEMLVNNRFQRIDPIKIGIDHQLQSGANNRNFLTSQLDFLPPAQRAAAIASLNSTTQSAENEVIFNTNVANAQNQAAAEQFNIGQSDRENIAQGTNLLNFEGRSLTAKANTEADLREYLRYNHNVAMNNFSNTQQLNLISNLTPDYSLDYYGMGVNYDPYYDFQVKNNDNLNRLGLGPTNTTEKSVDAEV